MEKYNIKLYSKGKLIKEDEYNRIEVIWLLLRSRNDCDAYTFTTYKLVDEKWIIDDVYNYNI